MHDKVIVHRNTYFKTKTQQSHNVPTSSCYGGVKKVKRHHKYCLPSNDNAFTMTLEIPREALNGKRLFESFEEKTSLLLFQSNVFYAEQRTQVAFHKKLFR
ncbi:hypothetical protein NPIL_55751 [Nephila pilipes]|uniref:Uncharacterized protein n=1 Tax=Nephila pilipes TaxID=299642 RepID=A0A8X6UNI1_NEPPI|nr:hypothetical protein NPIL_55751 [Nephila pilipes]